MHLLHLKLQNFRNFNALNLEFSPHFNLIYGANGSGKTSILEAIHFLSLGRSFRTHLINRVIQYHSDNLTVFGSLVDRDNVLVNLGIQKDKKGKLHLKIANETSHSIAQLAKLLPLQLLNPDSYHLLTEGPKQRREFLDWGVFHVELLFFSLWQRFQKSLAQRNAALQKNMPYSQIQAWDIEFVTIAIELTDLRSKYFKQLAPLLLKLFSDLITIDNFTITYNAGWNTDLNLQELLISNYHRDKAQGYTQNGPQRADIVFKINNVPAQDVLSRGEQKLLVCALKLAQGLLLQKLTGKRCLYLFDDLAAELDSSHREKIIAVLAELHAQVFITAVDKAVIASLIQNLHYKMFHVEHNDVY